MSLGSACATQFHVSLGWSKSAECSLSLHISLHVQLPSEKPPQPPFSISVTSLPCESLKHSKSAPHLVEAAPPHIPSSQNGSKHRHFHKGAHFLPTPGHSPQRAGRKRLKGKIISATLTQPLCIPYSFSLKSPFQESGRTNESIFTDEKWRHDSRTGPYSWRGPGLALPDRGGHWVTTSVSPLRAGVRLLCRTDSTLAPGG